MKSDDWHAGFEVGLAIGFVIGALVIIGCVIFLVASS